MSRHDIRASLSLCRGHRSPSSLSCPDAGPSCPAPNPETVPVPSLPHVQGQPSAQNTTVRVTESLHVSGKVIREEAHWSSNKLSEYKQKCFLKHCVREDKRYLKEDRLSHLLPHQPLPIANVHGHETCHTVLLTHPSPNTYPGVFYLFSWKCNPPL